MHHDNPLVIDTGSFHVRTGYANMEEPLVDFDALVGKPKNVTQRLVDKIRKMSVKKVKQQNPNKSRKSFARKSLHSRKSRRMTMGKKEVVHHSTAFLGGSDKIDVFQRKEYQFHSPINEKSGLIQNWDDLEHLWNYVLNSEVHSTFGESPLLVSEPHDNTESDRKKLLEFMFEKLGTPSGYVEQPGVLALYSTGRTEGCTFLCGHSKSAAVPVRNGLPVLNCSRTTRVAGHAISEYLQKKLFGRHTLNQKLVGSKLGLTDAQVATEVKHALGYVSLNYHDEFHFAKSQRNILTSSRVLSQRVTMNTDINRPLSTRSHEPSIRPLSLFPARKKNPNSFPRETIKEPEKENFPSQIFVLPDGTNVHVGSEKFECGELFFQPDILWSVCNESSIQSVVADAIEAAALSLELAKDLNGDHLSVVPDEDVNGETWKYKEMMWKNIVVCGGSTEIPGFLPRFRNELTLERGRTEVHGLLHGPINTIAGQKGSHASWIGGALLSSLDGFKENWISKQEYDEYGADVIPMKYPKDAWL